MTEPLELRLSYALLLLTERNINIIKYVVIPNKYVINNAWNNAMIKLTFVIIDNAPVTTCSMTRINAAV